jgi:hypothetical protein
MFAPKSPLLMSRVRYALALAGCAGLLWACGGGGGESFGTLRLALTDDPCYEQVNVASTRAAARATTMPAGRRSCWRRRAG